MSLIAAQYVLGVLSGSARAQVQARMLHDIALRDSVYQWERKLNPLASLLTESRAVTRVASELRATAWACDAHATVNPATAAPLTQAPPTLSTAFNFLNDVSRWKLWTGLSSAVAAGLALALMLRPGFTVMTPTEPTVIVQQLAIRDLTVLVDADNVPTWIVRQQNWQQLLLSSLTAQQIPSDRDLELWTIQGDQAPVRLGYPVRDGQGAG